MLTTFTWRTLKVRLKLKDLFELKGSHPHQDLSYCSLEWWAIEGRFDIGEHFRGPVDLVEHCAGVLHKLYWAQSLSVSQSRVRRPTPIPKLIFFSGPSPALIVQFVTWILEHRCAFWWHGIRRESNLWSCLRTLHRFLVIVQQLMWHLFAVLYTWYL